MSLTEDTGLVNSFEKLGLSPNEAKVYLALLENNPITGYQLSKNSGILRPVVYEMLNRLVEKGGARIVKSNPDTYSPVQIEEFLRNIQIDFSNAKENISSGLKGFLSVDESDFFWNITGKKSILNALIMMIEKAEKYILLGIQNQALYNDLAESIENKMSDKTNPDLTIDVFSYFSLKTGSSTLYSYNMNPDYELEGVLPELIYIVIDDKEAAIANISDIKTAKATHSKNNALIKMVKQNIMYNLYIYRLWKLHGIDKMKLILNHEDRKLLESIEKHLSGRLF